MSPKGGGGAKGEPTASRGAGPATSRPSPEHGTHKKKTRDRIHTSPNLIRKKKDVSLKKFLGCERMLECTLHANKAFLNIFISSPLLSLSLSLQPDGLVQPASGANNFHSRANPPDRRGSSPAHQGSEVVVNKTPLSKSMSASVADSRNKLAVAETRPHSADTKDTLKRDKLVEEVERIAVGTSRYSLLCLLRMITLVGISIELIIYCPPTDNKQRRVYGYTKISEDGVKTGGGVAAAV